MIVSVYYYLNASVFCMSVIFCNVTIDILQWIPLDVVSLFDRVIMLDGVSLQLGGVPQLTDGVICFFSNRFSIC